MLKKVVIECVAFLFTPVLIPMIVLALVGAIYIRVLCEGFRYLRRGNAQGS